MTATKNIVLAGVGGQGIVLASNILAQVLLAAGFDVKKSETHGMAQRGGAIVSFIRFGTKVFSPAVDDGAADWFLSFEKLEAARNLNFIHENSVVLINDQKILPLGVATGLVSYPKNLEIKIKKIARNTFFIPAADLARQAGSTRAVNLVMLGALSRRLAIPEKIWTEIISEYFPDQKKRALNLAAFHLG